LSNLSAIHHGVDLALYPVGEGKRDYMCFIGRIAPAKGTHTAIEVARRAGIPLKIAGEIQPIFREYWEQQVKPHVDGSLIEYIGEADFAIKTELLRRARALLFPIDWEEPFGLVMVEAMACGAPVLAFARGSVPEIIKDGVSGWISKDVPTMARQAQELSISPQCCREYANQHFSLNRMVDDYVALYDRLSSGELPEKLAASSTNAEWESAATDIIA
jgi:glycosyltransferase involved in cell wall biosynthesis